MPAPDRFERVETSSGCMLIFGIPLLTFGVLLAVAPLLGEAALEEGLPPSLLITVPFGLLFAALGTLLVFGRWGLDIDRAHGTVARWWGLFVPIRRAERRLDGFDRVVLSEEVTEVGGHENMTYAVRLAGGGQPMDLQHTIAPQAARLEAEAIARFTDLPLHDETGDEALVRQPGELDESVRERALREGEKRELEPPSEDSPVCCRLEGHTMVLQLPRRRLGLAGWWAVVVFFAAWVTPVSAVLVLQAERIGSTGAGLVFLGALALVFLVVPVLGLLAGLLRHLTTRETLRVSPSTVRLERSWLLGRQEMHLPGADLEEIRCTPESVDLVSDEQTIEVGIGLEPEDLRWLESVIHAVVTAP
jgi:hypothetical protein